MTPLLALLMFAALGSAADSAPPALTRVEAVDRTVSALVRDGYHRSSTFRSLVTHIEGSKWRVFILDGRCPDSETVGCLLHTVGSFRGDPYLRIRVETRGRNSQQLIATLAHELQHAWEVISDPTVVDTQTMSAMFRRIGFESIHRGSTLVFETVEADRVGTVVLHELDLDNERRR